MTNISSMTSGITTRVSNFASSIRYDVARYNLIYIYAINDDAHKGMLKIGQASFSSQYSIAQLTANCPTLNQHAHQRIMQQTHTALVSYELLHTELATKSIRMRDGSVQVQSFDDHDVHDVLFASNYTSMRFNESGRPSEWFVVDLETAKSAINAVKQGLATIPSRTSVTSSNVPKKKIKLRDEQEANVNYTISMFEKYDTMLWDCKMRYGKTVTAYELIKRKGFKKVIVITHRPAVEDSWDSDHNLMFEGTNHKFLDKTASSYTFNDKIDAENDFKLRQIARTDTPFVYFASIQDLRGSKRVGGKYNKNNAVFDMQWDLIIIDEAHEGVTTDLGDAVIQNLRKPGTKILSLSGTPYNIMGDFEENKFTWTYVDEQKAKIQWEETHPGEKNPYEELPQMNIFAFDISENMPTSYRYVTEDSAFNFREFFRTWTGDIDRDFRKIPYGKEIGDFVHEEDVFNFLSLISKDDSNSNYPFSTEEYRDMFAHTFWKVPGVKEARALSALLKRHPRFEDYEIVNIAGDGDEEKPYDEALALVKSSIKAFPKTITLSCGRLSTGVTVREWTGVMMLSGSASTAASGYMQTIFRVQSPGFINGKQKKNCYVFDFAPDRTLKVIGEVHRITHRGSQGDDSAKAALAEFINFCPVIAFEGTVMRTYDVADMMRQIKRISVDAAINSGFDDDTIYVSDAGMNLDKFDEDILRKLSDVVVPQKKGKRQTAVVITDVGMTDEQRKTAEKAKNKRKKELTPEEKEALELLKKQKEEQKKMFNLLRAVSIRLPLLFYGADADITEIIHLRDFVRIVDDESWAEFMPKGLRKELFLDILKYYDEDVVVGAGLRIRKMAKAADELLPTLRAKRIVEIMSKFKNPDKETVLTPWRVVNIHMGNTLGGYNFFDEEYQKELDEPRFIEQGDITADIFLNSEVKLLEMNSKSGLYPLYLAYSVYMLNVSGKEQNLSLEEAQKIWFNTLQQNIFVLCKTKMARMITIRTLAGYLNKNVNAIYLTKLIDERMKDIPRLAKKLTNPMTWGMEGERMKFDCIVGNPPYQLENSGDGNGKDPVYHLFIDSAISVSPRSTFIHPARFLFNAGKTPAEWNEKMLSSPHFSVIKYYDNSAEVFPTVDIKGGVAITYWDATMEINPIGVFSPHEEIRHIMDKVITTEFRPFADIIYKRDLYRLTDALYDENPWAESRPSKGHRYDVGSNIDEIFPELFTLNMPSNTDDEYIQIYTRTKTGRVNLWVKKKYIKLPDNFENYKVIVAKVNGAGTLGETLSTPVIGYPNVGHSATFLSIGNFTSEFEAQSVLKYITTKFARIMLGTLKVTQNNAREAWMNIPMQDFTKDSDINWECSISNIDQQLYSKYNLSCDEIKFIEETAISME